MANRIAYIMSPYCISIGSPVQKIFAKNKKVNKNLSKLYVERECLQYRSCIINDVNKARRPDFAPLLV